MSEPERRRGPGRPFPPGVSGNPGGMPKDLVPRVLECRRLALQHVPRAIETLVALLDDEDPAVRSAAATAIMDRGYLRPSSLEPERIEVTAVPIDAEELRESLMVRITGLGALPSPEPVATPEALVLPPRDGEAPAMTGRPLPRLGNSGSEGPPEVQDA